MCCSWLRRWTRVRPGVSQTQRVTALKSVWNTQTRPRPCLIARQMTIIGLLQFLHMSPCRDAVVVIVCFFIRLTLSVGTQPFLWLLENQNMSRTPDRLFWLIFLGFLSVHKVSASYFSVSIGTFSSIFSQILCSRFTEKEECVVVCESALSGDTITREIQNWV